MRVKRLDVAETMHDGKVTPQPYMGFCYYMASQFELLWMVGLHHSSAAGWDKVRIQLLSTGSHIHSR